jgi:hypothetical protein
LPGKPARYWLRIMLSWYAIFPVLLAAEVVLASCDTWAATQLVRLGLVWCAGARQHQVGDPVCLDCLMAGESGWSIMSVDAVPTQTSMEGAGFYNRHSTAQAAGIDQMLALLERAAGEVPVGEEALVIADYGSSQGRNSMAPMRVAIEALSSRCGHDRPALVFHPDLPSNEFTSLFGSRLTDVEHGPFGAGSRFRSVGA